MATLEEVSEELYNNSFCEVYTLELDNTNFLKVEANGVYIKEYDITIREGCYCYKEAGEIVYGFSVSVIFKGQSLYEWIQCKVDDFHTTLYNYLPKNINIDELECVVV